jgi:ParB/RepB/Spo0J family partition protein
MLIRRDKIRENPWNPNAFDPENYPKLVASIRERGIMEPLKVMPDPERPADPSTGSGQGYLLVDGYHRWKAAADLGIEELPCEVWNITVEEAKIRGLQLNYLRGQPVPQRLAGVLHDLSATYSLEDLAGMLPWSETELKDSLEILRLPADLQAGLRQQAQEQEAAAPHPVTVVLVGTEYAVFERAMEHAKRQIGRGTSRGACLAAVCEIYLANQHVPDAE